jgi:hypothetical protein
VCKSQVVAAREERPSNGRRRGTEGDDLGFGRKRRRRKGRVARVGRM